MMATSKGCSEVASIMMRIDPNRIEEGAKALLKELMPCLEETDLQIKSLGGGMVNHLVLCKNLKTQEEPGWVVRIFGEADVLLPRDRAHERKAICLLSASGLAPKVRCFFVNGVCYDYVEGKLYSWGSQDFKEEYMINSISNEMARWHCSTNLAEANHIEFDQSPTPVVHMRKLLKSWPKGFEDEQRDNMFKESFPSLPNLELEVTEIEKTLKKLEMPIVFGHNDLSMTNLIFLPETGRMMFIDYEWAGMTYAAWDIGIHLAYSFVGLDTDPTGKLPERSCIARWATSYLDHLGALEGKTFSEKDRDTLVSNVEIILPYCSV
ncbi:ethanolamine kinase 1-like [Lineus longissimus]|uniref:ethanolamine kinase 1-like n=1 Tax=Lineus longissimus TaxID=88925 RepID=UPI00315CCF65